MVITNNIQNQKTKEKVQINVGYLQNNRGRTRLMSKHFLLNGHTRRVTIVHVVIVKRKNP